MVWTVQHDTRSVIELQHALRQLCFQATANVPTVVMATTDQDTWVVLIDKDDEPASAIPSWSTTTSSMTVFVNPAQHAGQTITKATTALVVSSECKSKQDEFMRIERPQLDVLKSADVDGDDWATLLLIAYIGYQAGQWMFYQFEKNASKSYFRTVLRTLADLVLGVVIGTR
jgi:hypothetical protein